MAFPTVSGRQATAATANGTAANDAIPTVAQGDLLIVPFSVDGTTAPSWGSGWTGYSTFQGLVTVGNSACQLGVFYRICDGSEGNLTFALGASENWCTRPIVISAGTFDPNLPPAFGTAVSSSGANPDPPSLNPADWGTVDTLWVAVSAGDDNVAYTAADGNYGNTSFQLSSDATAGNRVALAVAERQLNAASDDPAAFTRGAEDASTNTLGIPPLITTPKQPIGWCKSFYSSGTATVDVTVTIQAGTNRRFVVHTAIELSAATFTSVTLDPAGVNTALTLCTDGTTSASQNQDSVAFNRFWSLIDANLPSPGTYTLRVIVSTATEVFLTAMMVTNTDQTQNVASVAVNGTTSGTSATAAVTIGTDNSLVLSGCYKNNAATPNTSMTAAGLNMMPRGSGVLPTNGAHFLTAAKELTTETGSQNVVQTVPGAVRLSLVAMALKPAISSTVAATLLAGLVGSATVDAGDGISSTVAAVLSAGLTGAATVAQTETSTVAATLAGLTAAATVTQTETFTVGPPPPRQAWIGSSTLKGTLGVTTSWTEHYTSFLQGIEADASFLNLGENAYTSWELLPTGTTGQPGFAPAVDTARNVTTALAHPGVQLVGYNANEILQARDDFGFAGDLDTPGTGYVDAYLIPNLITIAAECAAAGVPFVVCTAQPRDTDSDADFIAGTVYANQRIYETFGADRVIDFHAFLVDVDGTLQAAYTTDGVHPDDTATPGLSDLVEAKRLELLASSFPPIVVAASVNPSGVTNVSSTAAAVLTGLTGAATVVQAAQPATVAAVLAAGLTGAATVTVASPVTMTVAASLAGLTVDASMVHDDGTGGGATGGTRRRSRKRFRGFAPQ